LVAKVPMFPRVAKYNGIPFLSIIILKF